MALKSTLSPSLSLRSSSAQDKEIDDWKTLLLLQNKDHDDQDEDDADRSDTSSIGACSSSSDVDVDEEEPPQNNNNNNDDDSQKSSLSSLDSLEDSLPFKRGLSNFYSGKSKSFTSLSSAAATASAKDIVKPDNPLNKRRRLFIARSRNRRASCTSLVSIAEAESSFRPLLPPVLYECDDEDDDDDDDPHESLHQASPSSSQSSHHQQPPPQLSMMRRSRTEKRRPSLFTVSVSVSVTPHSDHDSTFLTPKLVRSGSGSSKLPLKSPARSLSLSDLTRHAHLAQPMPDLN